MLWIILYTFLFAHMPSTLSMKITVFHFLCPSEVSQGIMCLYLCQKLFCLSVCLLDWLLTFIEKCDCDKVNHVVSMISITTILVKLMQMIGCYVNELVVCLSFCLYLQKKSLWPPRNLTRLPVTFRLNK